MFLDSSSSKEEEKYIKWQYLVVFEGKITQPPTVIVRQVVTARNVACPLCIVMIEIMPIVAFCCQLKRKRG
jgi:hypothetical protein